MKTVWIEPRAASDDFFIIMRENLEDPLGSKKVEVNGGRFEEVEHALYDDEEEAVEKCRVYAKARRRSGYSYRYFVLKTVAMVQYAPDESVDLLVSRS